MLNLEKGSYYAADTAAEAQILLDTPDGGQRWSIGGVKWSYSKAELAVGAGLTIWCPSTAAAGNIVISVSSGDTANDFISDELIFAEPVKFPSRQPVVIELASGGSNVMGKVNVLGAKLV